MGSDIKNILSIVLEMDISRISDDFSSESCSEWDSLKQMMIIAALEEETGLSFSPDEIIQMNSFQAIQNIIHTKKDSHG